MQWLAEICIKRPVFAIMLIAALVVAGVASFLLLGIDRLPRMDLPTVIVQTTYPGAAPEDAESEVSQVLEDAVATVSGIDELRSISREGQSLLILTFTLSTDIDTAANDVRDAVNRVLNRLPPGIDPPVIRKQDTDSSPIMTLAVSGPRDPRELYLLADWYVKGVIESAHGVGEVRIAGATERAMQINVEAKRLAAYRLSIMQIREALTRQHADVPGGRVDIGHRELGLRTLGRVSQEDAFENLVIATVDGSPVRIKDVGDVVDGTKEARTLARLNGVPAVVLEVQRQSGSNTVEVIEAVKDKLTRSQSLLPPDVKVTVLQDQSRYIHAAMHEVELHLIVGSLLASGVVLVFMKSWRSTFIAAVAIPTSIIATFAAIKLFGFTLNNVTMLALVLMVGVVIDDAIVVLENIFRCIEEEGLPPMQAAVVGTRQIGLAVLATTLSLVIVFLPVSFLSSLTGRLLYEFGTTATVAILISMLVSFSLTPMMCSRMLKPSRVKNAEEGHRVQSEHSDSRGGFYAWIDRGYEFCLRQSLRFRWLVLLLSLGVIYANVPLYEFVRQDYIPTNVDESEFEVSINLPEGATIRTADRTLQRVEEEIQSIPGVESALTTVGTRGGGSTNSASIYVRIQDITTRTFSFERLLHETLAGNPKKAWEGNFSQRDVMTAIRQKLKPMKDLQVSVRNQTSLRTGAPVDIDFTITGPSLAELIQYSAELEQRAKQIPGIVDVIVTLRVDKPELLVDVDRERAAALGVDVREIAETLRIAVGGDDRVARFRDPRVDDAYDVEIRLEGIDRNSPESISQLYVRGRPMAGAGPSGMAIGSASGGAAPSEAPLDPTRIDNVVRFRYDFAPARIDRLDRQRMIAVRANVGPGYALGDRITALQKAADDMHMPEAFSTRVLGRGRELERTFADFQWTFILSFVFMYIVLAAQYEHMVHPFTILFSLPLAVPFGLISLWLGNETLNLYSALGVLVLFGVVKKAAILQVDHTNVLREQGLDRHTAIIQANRDRLRPILMTTIAFVAGMLPLLIGTGPGAEERRSIAVLAVGGQTLSLLLTLVAVPVVYTFFDDIGAWLHGMGRKKAVPESHTLNKTPEPSPE